MNTPRPSRRHALGWIAAAAAPLPAWGAEGGLPSARHEDSSPEWEKLSARLFAGRPLLPFRHLDPLALAQRALHGDVGVRPGLSYEGPRDDHHQEDEEERRAHDGEQLLLRVRRTPDERHVSLSERQPLGLRGRRDEGGGG